MTETQSMTRTVSADIDLDVTGPGRVVFQVAVVKSPGLTVDETFDLTLDGKPIQAREVVGVTGSRFHWTGKRTHEAPSSKSCAAAEARVSPRSRRRYRA